MTRGERMRFYIDCPYNEKEEAKALGAKWDGVEKSWYYVAPQQDSRFDKWQAPIASNSEISAEQNTEQQSDLTKKVDESTTRLIKALEKGQFEFEYRVDEKAFGTNKDNVVATREDERTYGIALEDSSHIQFRICLNDKDIENKNRHLVVLMDKDFNLSIRRLMADVQVAHDLFDKPYKYIEKIKYSDDVFELGDFQNDNIVKQLSDKLANALPWRLEDWAFELTGSSKGLSLEHLMGIMMAEKNEAVKATCYNLTNTTSQTTDTLIGIRDDCRRIAENKLHGMDSHIPNSTKLIKDGDDTAHELDVYSGKAYNEKYGHRDIHYMELYNFGEGDCKANVRITVDQSTKNATLDVYSCDITPSKQEGNILHLPNCSINEIINQLQQTCLPHLDFTPLVVTSISKSPLVVTPISESQAELYPALVQQCDSSIEELGQFTDEELKIMDIVVAGWKQKAFEFDEDEIFDIDDYGQRGFYSIIRGIKNCKEIEYNGQNFPNLLSNFTLVDEIEKKILCALELEEIRGCKTPNIGALKEYFDTLRSEDKDIFKKIVFATENFYDNQDIVKTYMSTADKPEIADFISRFSNMPSVPPNEKDDYYTALVNRTVQNIPKKEWSPYHVHKDEHIALSQKVSECVSVLYERQIKGERYRDNQIWSKAEKSVSKHSDTKEKQHKPKSDYDDR